MTEEAHKGGCPCGLVSYEVRGSPNWSAYCHCTRCQKQLACPFVHTIHFSASAFKWTHEQADDTVLDAYDKGGIHYRCKKCGAAVACHDPQGEVWVVRGAHFERDEQGKIKNWDTVKPTAHIFYDTRMLDVNDGLGKWARFEAQSERL